MPDNNDNRNLSDVFKELQQMQQMQRDAQIAQVSKKHFKTRKTKVSRQHISPTRDPYPYKNHDLKLPHIIVGCGILIIGLAIVFPKNTSLTQSYAKEEEIEPISEYELNRHRLNMQNIISENSNMDRVKEQITEEREIEFETEYNNNPTLPKSEEVIMREGANGKENVTAIRTFENGTFVEETILDKQRLVDPVSKVIDIGTSEFLAKHKVHIGDTMYLVSDSTLKKETNAAAEDVAVIKKYLDVKLLELPSEEWCKVSFDSIEGYIKTSSLTSTASTPNIAEKNRIQRILIKVDINMELNKSSGLSLTDYKNIFSNLSSDTNHIFRDNYTAFYNAEKKYNINGIFLASVAIHESNWGTSQIAKDKKNLFGYGSYDATPYDSSFVFTDYAEGIDTVAKSLVKYYLNPAGTKIYDNETAVASYFNGPTLQGVNTRYASDKEWYNKVYKHMETLYNSLQS